MDGIKHGGKMLRKPRFSLFDRGNVRAAINIDISRIKLIFRLDDIYGQALFDKRLFRQVLLTFVLLARYIYLLTFLLNI